MKKPYAVRMDNSLRAWLQAKADREERTIATTLDRILRDARAQDEEAVGAISGDHSE